MVFQSLKAFFFLLINVKKKEEIVLKLKITFKYYLSGLYAVLVCSLIFVFIDYLVKKNFGFSIWENKSNTKSLITKNGLWATFFLICFRLPIIEELAFRLWMSFKKYHLIIGSFFFLYLVTGLLNVFSDLYYRSCCIFILIALFFILINRKTKENLTYVGERYFNQFKFLSIFSFGLLHISNFTPLDSRILFVYPILVVPQIIMGYYLLKIRLELGFSWSISLHILNNLFAFFLSLI